MVCAFAGGDGIEQLADFLPEFIGGSFGGFAEEGLEFGEELFDEVPIGRRGRQIESPGASRGDGLPDPVHLVAAEVVEEGDVSGLECGAEELLDPGQEQLPIHGPVDDHGSGQSMVAQASDKGRGLPIAKGRRSDASTALGGTAVAARHVGRGPGFIDKDQLFDIHRRLRFTPCASCGLHVLALLRAGVQGFF